MSDCLACNCRYYHLCRPRYYPVSLIVGLANFLLCSQFRQIGAQADELFPFLNFLRPIVGIRSMRCSKLEFSAAGQLKISEAILWRSLNFNLKWNSSSAWGPQVWFQSDSERKAAFKSISFGIHSCSLGVSSLDPKAIASNSWITLCGSRSLAAWPN